MQQLLNAVQAILNVGAVALLPIMVMIIGLFFRMKPSNAVKSGLLVGIGFQGLSLVIGLLFTTINPVIQYYTTMGAGFTTTDMGWAAVGAASWSVPFAPIAIPLIFLLNIVMLKLHWTKVMNVDIWNFIHMLIPGALAYALFDSTLIGVSVTLICAVIALKFGEKLAPEWQEQFGLEGTTCTTVSFVLMYPLLKLLDKLYDHIPGFNKLNFDFQRVNDKLGIFGNPAFVGVIVGIILGVITKQQFTTILQIALGFASVLVLLPKMVSVMMEGISPLGTSAAKYMKKSMGEDADIYIGMDVCLGLGDPAAIIATSVCIPLTILFAFIIPGMTYFPIGLLSVVVYMMVMPVLAHKGNIARTILTGAILMFITAWLANIFAPEATLMLQVTGVQVEGMVTDGFFGFGIPNIILSIIHRLFML
jgi:PTS system galactitol-specific IIC component